MESLDNGVLLFLHLRGYEGTGNTVFGFIFIAE